MQERPHLASSLSLPAISRKTQFGKVAGKEKESLGLSCCVRTYAIGLLSEPEMRLSSQRVKLLQNLLSQTDLKGFRQGQ